MKNGTTTSSRNAAISPYSSDIARILLGNIHGRADFFKSTLRHSLDDQYFIIDNLQLPSSAEIILLKVISFRCFLAMSSHKVNVISHSLYLVENVFITLIDRSIIAKAFLAQRDAVVEIATAVVCVAAKARAIINGVTCATHDVGLTPCAEHVFGQFAISVRCPCWQEQRSDTGYESAGNHCFFSFSALSIRSLSAVVGGSRLPQSIGMMKRLATHPTTWGPGRLRPVMRPHPSDVRSSS